MAAISKEDLERLEAKYGLEPDGLTYQHRCSRITAYEKGEGESWEIPPKTEARQMKEQIQQAKESRPIVGPKGETVSKISRHPLYGTTLLICPLIKPDKNRALSYDEPLGPEMEVEEFEAGRAIHDLSEQTDRMFGDYIVKSIDSSRRVVAIAGFPKIGTELTYRIGFDLVPVVRGNNNHHGYIWSMPSMVVQVDDTLVQLHGLKTLIQNVAPRLIADKVFSGKPIMEYIDGVTLAADIPLTTAALQKYAKEEFINERAGLNL